MEAKVNDGNKFSLLLGARTIMSADQPTVVKKATSCNIAKSLENSPNTVLEKVKVITVKTKNLCSPGIPVEIIRKILLFMLAYPFYNQ